MIRATTLAEMHRWAWETFGPGRRVGGITKHIEKELAEVRADPTDLEEWVDIIILGLDGAMRCAKENVCDEGRYVSDAGAALMVRAAVAAKVAKNRTRQYPAETPEDQPVEHIRGIND